MEIKIIDEKLKRIFNEIAGKNVLSIGGDAPLTEHVNSIALIKVLMSMEKEFDVTIEEDELSLTNFSTLNKMRGFLNSKLANT